MELALGTVQFGLNYGNFGRGHLVPAEEVRSILRSAFEFGIRVLDTAPAYGQIESRLSHLCNGLPFRAISKIPKLPSGLTAKHTADMALKSAEYSHQLLGDSLAGLLFHHVGDVLGQQGELVWSTVHYWASKRGIKLGISGYTPEDIESTRHVSPEMFQLPGSAWDQRVKLISPCAPIELHLRSVFLQGLLLSSLDCVRAKLPQAVSCTERWQRWAQLRGLNPLIACLSIVKSFTSVRHVIIGVDGLDQWHEVCTAWQEARPLDAPELGETNLSIIDPRLWKIKRT